MDGNRYPDDESKVKKGFGKKKDDKKDKKDKGYIMFEEENSEEEVLVSKETRTPMKLKKHSKPSFKFAKKPKEKEKDKEDKRKDEKEKKKEEKVKSKKKKLGNLGSISSIPSAEDSPVFGVTLPIAIQRSRTHDGILLPSVVRECIDYVEEYGLTSEGIYRVSGVKSKVQALKELYNKGISVYLKEYEPSVVASLFKQFLRELPEPVLTTELMPKFEQSSTIKNVKQKVEEFQHLIERLPAANKILLSWTIIHMTHVIAREKQNKMSLQNVSIVLSPTMQISHRVLNIFFSYSKILFKDTVIKKYVPPLKPVTSRWSLDLPDSPNSLEEELRKQESLLDELHKELMKVKDTEKEEQLWEVQRVVTGLKRKLKFMKKAQEGTPGRSPKFTKSFAQQSAELKRKQKIDLTKEKRDETNKESQAKEGITPAKTQEKVKNISTPSKITLDFGEIEVDDSAQSQRHRRKDSHGGVLDVIVQKDRKEASKAEESVKKESETKESEEVVHKKETHEGSDQDENENEEIHEDRDIQTDADSVKKEPEQNKSETEKTEEVKIDNKTDEQVNDSSLKNEDKVEVEETNTSSVQQAKIESTSSHDTEDKEISDAVEIPKLPENSTEQVTDTKIDESEDVAKEESENQSSNNNRVDVTKDVPVEEDAAEEATQLAQQQPVENDTLAPEIPPPHNSARAGIQPVPGVTLATDAGAGKSTAYTGVGVEPEKLAAALSSLVVHETEEDLNQRVMSEFVQDFGIERSESIDQDEEYEELLREHQALLLEEEELNAIGDELQQKIETEQNEIERLREEIMEIQVMREDIYSSDNSSMDSSSDDESLDGEDLEQVLTDLIRENSMFETKNRDLCDKIHQERQICLEVKVQIRMLQQKQLESSMSNQLDLLL